MKFFKNLENKQRQQQQRQQQQQPQHQQPQHQQPQQNTKTKSTTNIIMNFMKTSSANATQYESVEDSKDLRIPVQSEEAFEHGINFKCKVSDTIIILILHTILYLTHLPFIMNMRLSKYVYLPSFVKISNFWALREFL